MAIDRRTWFPLVGIELTSNEEIRMTDGSLKVAEGYNFGKRLMGFPEIDKKNYLQKSDVYISMAGLKMRIQIR